MTRSPPYTLGSSEIAETGEAKHTALPWRIEGPDMFGDYNILSPEAALAVGAVVSNLRPAETVKANAEFIIRACNAHDDLVAALNDILNGVSCRPGYISTLGIQRARAALAKAESK